MADSKRDWKVETLRLAAVYNVAWGAVVVFFPSLFFEWAGMEQPRYPEIWQCVGMVVGVFGVGYAIAALDPLRHWPIVLVGFLGKVLGPIGFFMAWFEGRLPLEFGWVILTNDLIWLAPFAGILLAAYDAFRREEDRRNKFDTVEEALRKTEVEGESLYQMSLKKPVLLVFLRHGGCTFCREALGDLASVQERIRKSDTRLVVVQMGTQREGLQLARRFGLERAVVISDPRRSLYRAFDLKRGRLSQLFGVKVWLRGVWAGLLKGYGLGWFQGDGSQMPGTFLIRNGRVVDQFRHESAADRPDYVALASCNLDSGEASADGSRVA